jgi:hypothetical protein
MCPVIVREAVSQADFSPVSWEGGFNLDEREKNGVEGERLKKRWSR